MTQIARIASLSILGGLGLLITGQLGSACAAGYAVVYTFKGGSDGASPEAGLAEDASGNLYGTTAAGGGTNCSGGCGTVFKLAVDGTETVLHDFGTHHDGIYPRAQLIVDRKGDLVGTTTGGYGTVFKLAASGREKVLYSFTGGNDGSSPFAGVTRDKSGNFLGTTLSGGDSGQGAIFELAPNGTESVLYSFRGYPVDGIQPWAHVIADKQGNLYGTTSAGGDFTCGAGGCGTVFKLAPDGTETVLHTFEFSDGATPVAGLISDKAGNFYGTTAAGGPNGFGTVFTITPGGTQTVLYSFTNGADGGSVEGEVLLDRSGNLYGTAFDGGAYGDGVVFKLAPDGTETVLHSFGGKVSDGKNPEGALITDAAGYLYGITYSGGKDGYGTVFRVKE